MKRGDLVRISPNRPNRFINSDNLNPKLVIGTTQRMGIDEEICILLDSDGEVYEMYTSSLELINETG